MGLKEQWDNLTPAEKAVIALLTVKNPSAPFIIKASKDLAFNETKKRFGYNGHNDKSDAFRHCFWSATLARDLGYVEAKMFTDAHESNPTNPPDEKEMDLHNNGVGLGIGQYFLIPDSNDTLSQSCYNALVDGKLIVISP